jgi:TonB family protein
MKTLLIAILLLTAGLSAADVSMWIPSRIQAMKYPILGLQAQISGKVHMLVNLDENGTVAEVRVVSGPTLLANAARENMRLWKFIAVPGKVVAGPVTIAFLYDFQLQGDARFAPTTDFVYEYPGIVRVTSQPQHFTPLDNAGRDGK